MKPTITNYLQTTVRLFSEMAVTDQDGMAISLDEGAQRAADLILKASSQGAKILVAGNGGSAATASHLHNDFCKAAGIRCLIFNDFSLLTALANDDGYECVYERPMDMWAFKGDILIAISCSGLSENILRMVKIAIRKNCSIITFTGFKAQNTLRRLGHLNFYIASEVYGYVEVAHSILAHYLTDAVMDNR